MAGRCSSGCGRGARGDSDYLLPGALPSLSPNLQQLRLGKASAVGPVAALERTASAAKSGYEDSAHLSAGASPEELQSDESHHSPYRSSQHQQQQSGQQNSHPMKSAKRRAAEALLAARLDGASAAAWEGLQPFPAFAMASAVLDVRQASTCVCCPSSEADAAGTSGGGGRRHLCSSSAVPTDSQSTGTAVDGPDLPAGAAASGPAGRQPSSQGAANTSGVPGGLSLLQQRVDSLAAAAAAGDKKKNKVASMAPDLERVRPARAVPAAPAAVPRQAMQVPGPPPKRARLSLSAAATSSLGAGLSGTSQASQQQQQQQPAAGAAASTRVPPCDPARGCKARLRDAAEAAGAAALKRRGSAAAVVQGGDEADGGVSINVIGSGSGGSSSSEADPGTHNSGGVRAATSAVGHTWCGFEVTLPPVNWQAVFDEPPGALQRYSIARGYEKLLLPQGLVTYVVESERHIGDALRHLKASMQDRVVAIDLEWRPETVAGRVSPVALLQLSTASVCVAVRTCCMGYCLPAELATFLRGDSASGPLGSPVLLGFGWDSADEAKMRGTFGLGRADFGKFLDLQEVASSLGYHGFGLSRLSQQVLGLPLHKSKSISRSNWAAPQLTNHQLKYASLDVLVAGQLFRALRLWHSSPSPCADCRSPIGELVLPGPLRCGNPACTARPASNLHHHRDHCASTGHPARFTACGTCGRLHELPGPAEVRRP